MDSPWLRLAELARRDGITPVLVGGPESREELDRIASASGSISLAGRTSLPQLLALMDHGMGTVAVDTGIAHLAAATGKPTVVVFGFGSEFLDLPRGELATQQANLERELATVCRVINCVNAAHHLARLSIH